MKGDVTMPSEEGSQVPEFLTVDEAAALLLVNRKTLYESIRLEQVPGVVRIGKSLRIRRAALLESSPGKGRDIALGKKP
ncbi:DNA binding domain-containing protein, excisionase family [Stigmatella aurantiaca]|uniref:DNA binding domain-containing protein, excisionase family n=1 Tax=Stigmatella aurantiaca TaxID=41 RepID=A0A1H8G136_STIAU|nr:helix-turn-helix domain-containing protein [Stigmatella aurantiaca]SEN37495.1 DNA binding domain-containing protein, excisionase family [Stigmatella aurantiaca]